MDNFSKLTTTILESTSDEKFIEFIKTRQSGAKRIQEAATAKGGPATLTAHHFKAKHKPYTQALEKVYVKDRENFYKNRANDCLKKIQRWEKLSQKEFQEVMGEFEVWGELYIKSAK